MVSTDFIRTHHSSESRCGIMVNGSILRETTGERGSRSSLGGVSFFFFHNDFLLFFYLNFSESYGSPRWRRLLRRREGESSFKKE